ENVQVGPGPASATARGAPASWAETAVHRPRPAEEDAVQTVPRVRGYPASRDLNRLHEDAMSLGDRLADRLARLGGSWASVVTFGGVLALWIGLNSLQLLVKPFDPYPYRLLGLLLSGLAAIQAPIILMSLNRLAARDRLLAEQAWRRNLRGEADVEQL